MANTSIVSAYKTKIKELLDTIVFDGSTLGTKGLVFTYRKSLMGKPHAQINIYRKNYRVTSLESKLHKNLHSMVISVFCNPADREDLAEMDMDYLIEQITTQLENITTDETWTGWLDNDTINIKEPRFDTDMGWYIQDIEFIINEWKSHTN